ncbi:MAG: thioredoxin family protein [Candidatus Promineifilaceae bacterium]
MGLFDIFKRKQKAYHHVIDVTDDTFDIQVMQRSFKHPLLVDFWASWCVPCRQLGPVLEKIAMEPDSKVRLAKFNTEHNPIISQKFGIQSIPAVKMMRNGTIIGAFQGLQMEHNIRRFIDEKTQLDPPKIRMRMAKEGNKRLKQAQQYVQKGDGFRATILLQSLNDMPEAQALLPLAQFLWDVSDGDAMTGTAKVDDLYFDALESAENGNFTVTKEKLMLAGRQEASLAPILAAFEHL